MTADSNLVCFKVDRGRVKLAEQPAPVPGEGEIIMRTTLSTICGSDIHIVDETPVDPARVPAGMPGVPLGHEAVGVVESVGPGVRELRPGQRVIPSCLTSCGRCRQCLEGQPNACSGGGGLLLGCQARFIRVPFADINATVIPDELSDEQVLLATDIMSTGLGAVERGEVKFGDTVAVFAQGPVGLCVTAGARARGAGLIIAVEGVPARAAMAKRMGANVVLDPAAGDPVQAIMQLTGGQGVDVAIEAVGLQATFEAATRSVRRGGTVSSVGVYGGLEGITVPTAVPSFFQRKLVFTLCPIGRDRLQQLMRLVQYGGLDLTPLLTHRMPLEKTPEAYDLFRSRADGVLKIALTP